VLRGKYHLDRVIGAGGMAVVYAATHRNKKQFAVKILHPELSRREDLRQRFLREGLSANSLKHPGAVEVLDDDVAEDGAAFLVMELLEGLPLDRLWERTGSRMPLPAVLAIGYQLLDVLAAAHAAGVIHRDIKPPNLFLTPNGTLKVLDFGIARVRDVLADGSQNTSTGALLGTPGFMAPEQAMGDTLNMDGRTDIWAAGATLFALLSGRYVHLADNAAKLLILSGTQPAPLLRTILPELPPAAASVIDRALMFDRDQRWSSAADMRNALRDATILILGQQVSPAPLASLVQEAMIEPAGPDASTREVPALAAALAAGSSDLHAVQPGTPAAYAPTGPAFARPPGPPPPGTPWPPPQQPMPRPLLDLGTSNPVSTDSSPRVRTAPTRQRFVIAGVAAVIGFSVGLWLFLPHAAPESVGAAAAASTAASAVPAVSPPPPVVVPTAEPPVTAAPPATAAAPPPTVLAPSATAAAVATTSRPSHGASPPRPCKLVKTVDKMGEEHFSCPCPKCQ
jgi:serine/threonine-protein kinase